MTICESRLPLLPGLKDEGLAWKIKKAEKEIDKSLPGHF